MKRKKIKKQNIKGSSERPRLSVFKSNTNIYAQIIDDINGVTLASSSSMKLNSGNNISAAEAVGAEIAKNAKTKKISKVVFDRGRYVYKGRVKALADSARENGLEF